MSEKSITNVLPEVVKRVPEADQIEAMEKRRAEQRLAAWHSQRERRLRVWRNHRGSRYADCTLDTFVVNGARMQAAHDKVSEILEPDRMKDLLSEGANVVFYGPPGTGKDHLLAAMINRLLGGGVEYVSAPRERSTKKQARELHWTTGVQLCSIFRDFDDRDEFVMCQRIPILAISDPVVAELTAFQAERYYELLDYRYNHKLPTWITANVADSSDLATKLTPQVADRIRHGAVAIHCNWESFRKPA